MRKAAAKPAAAFRLCENALIPNAVGVDIGCGTGAIKTNLRQMMEHMKAIMFTFFPNIEYALEVNIHQRYLLKNNRGSKGVFYAPFNLPNAQFGTYKREA
ncbi:hypothetical protein AGMMS50255_7660 [Spirochaetia bacterium]|nr:hypothetical protein AGMMS50255_7660 [Spirochaetia bacterium]